MTREEAVAVLQKIKPTPQRGDGKSITHALEIIALDMAIKALEQEPILEKIKDEIDLLSDSRCDENTVTIYSWGGMKRRIFEIIDKYMTESEV